MDITAIKKMKDDVSESFSGLSSGVNGTISEFSHRIRSIWLKANTEVRFLLLLSEPDLIIIKL